MWNKHEGKLDVLDVTDTDSGQGADGVSAGRSSGALHETELGKSLGTTSQEVLDHSIVVENEEKERESVSPLGDSMDTPTPRRSDQAGSLLHQLSMSSEERTLGGTPSPCCKVTISY